MQRNKVILTVGISNSGKTTWAEQQDAVNINRDDLRVIHYCRGKTLSQYKFSKAKEQHITEVQFKMAERSINHGHDVVISDTNLNPKTRKRWQDWANTIGAEFTLQTFPCEPHIAKARNLKREHTIPPSAIDRQYLQWREFSGECKAPYETTGKLPKAVIFDVDGTLADMTGVRKPFDWHLVGKDKPRHNVVKLARSLHSSGYKIIVMSGRDGVCFTDTSVWLQANQISYLELIMREAGDSRPDAVVKEELFWNRVAPDYDVEFVVDDRDQMVDRWRAMGLECWQVQPGPF